MKNIFTIIFFSLCSGLSAAHIIGGEMTYQCLGNNNYEITLTLYRDCNSTGAQLDQVASLGIYNNSGLAYNIQLAKGATQTLPANFGNPCVGSATQCIEYASYIDTISLVSISGGYTLTYQRCCRIPGISNITNSDDYGITVTTSIPSNDNCNSSPQWSSTPPLVLCVGSSVSIPMQVSDADNDSISYEFCELLHGGGKGQGGGFNTPAPNPPAPPPYSVVPFSGTFSAQNPLPSLPIFSINPITGLITGTPNTTGKYCIGIKADEWRNGYLINSVRRDLTIDVVSSCSAILNQPNNFSANTSVGYARFHCVAFDSNATYQWQENNGTGWQNITNGNGYIGANSDTLEIGVVHMAMNGYQYRCALTGCLNDTSNIATLNVNYGVSLGEYPTEIILKPNPNSGVFTLEAEESIVGSEYELIDELGRLIEKGKIETALESFDLSGKPKGIYRLSIKSTIGIKTMAVVVQ